MDNTLLGALIGGGAAIAGAIATSVITYFSNKNHENIKLLKQKKEELYLSVYDTSVLLEKYHLLFSQRLISKKEIDVLDNNWRHTIRNISMCIEIYFPQLKDDLRKALSPSNSFLNDEIKTLKTYSQEGYVNVNISISGLLKKSAATSYNKATKALDDFEIKILSI
ncbi:hypothetical protein PTT65_17665 [Serratia ureilytica]|uniref:hypothetical protein n=1 Tax=Serratia ureilytica TaxID=300181 RepID=UPI00313C121C